MPVQIINPSPRSKNHQFTDLKTVLTKYFYHWPLFILGLLLALIAACVYLQVTPSAYYISAAILVNDEKKSPQEKSEVPELNLSSSPKNAETEIQVLTSKKLIAKVVSDLQLNATYTKEKFLGAEDLYQTSPVKFIVAAGSLIVGKHEISILIKDDQTFQVLSANASSKNSAFNEINQSSFGNWSLQQTPFLKQYIGATIRITIADSEKTLNKYTKSLDAHLLDKSAPTIGLFITDVVPQRGKQFLNYLIKEYNIATAAEERRITKSTIEFIDKRLASLTVELSNAETKVEDYRSGQGLTDISSQSKVYLENVQLNDTKLNDVNVQLSNIDGLENYVNSSNSKNIAPATFGIADVTLNSLVEKLTQLQLKRVALLTTTPEGNPLFEPINMQIMATKSAIKENIEGIKTSLLSEKGELQSVKERFDSAIKDIPGQERQYIGMKRQESIKENLYVYLLQKREELALSYASRQADARIVDNANVGDVKWPRPSLVFAIALLLGLGVPFMIIYFRYAFNQKVIAKQEIEDELEIPILGEISYGDLGEDIIVMDHHRHIIAEQFRSIRTNLYGLHKNNAATEDPILQTNLIATPQILGRITLCTSSTSHEGKSFVASNLATSIAASGRKTVLLEMDLRMPRISTIFKLSAGALGISEFLGSSIPLAQVIHPSGVHPNLFIIGSGEILKNPSELLEGPKLAELLHALQEQFEDIIIDSPPLHLVTDAMIIARFAHICLYIIRQGHTSKQELEFIRGLSISNQLPHMHIIFNGITKGKYGYGYNYDNNYYSKIPKQKDFKSTWKLLISRL